MSLSKDITPTFHAMRVLETSTKALRWLGISSQQSNVSNYELFKSSRFHFAMAGFILTISTSATYISKNRSNDSKFLDVISALGQLQAILGHFGSFIAFGVNMNKSKSLRRQLQRIIDDGIVNTRI